MRHKKSKYRFVVKMLFTNLSKWLYKKSEMTQCDCFYCGSYKELNMYYCVL